MQGARPILLLFSFLFLPGAGNAFAQGAQQDKTVSQVAPTLRFGQVLEGLPQTNVRAMAQDLHGFIWFGTQNGAARYDGTRFVEYRPEPNKPDSLSHKLVHAMAVDRAGNLWIGTDNGLNRYDPRTDRFKRYLHEPNDPNGIGSEVITALYGDRSGRMWIALSSGGLDEYDARSDSFRHHASGELAAPITAISEDSDGGLWLATFGRGVLRWKPGSTDVTAYRNAPNDEQSLGSDTVSAILVDRSGAVWAGTKRGLCRIDPTTSKVKRYMPREGDATSLSNEDVSVLLQDRDGRLWVGTYRGFNLFDPGTNRFVQFHHEEGDAYSIAYEHQTSILQDRGGVIWVGTFAGGASKFDTLQLGFGLYHTGGQAAVSFFQDADGVLWIGTYQSGLYKFEQQHNRMTRYRILRDPATNRSINLEETWIGAIHRDGRGTLWLGTQTLGLIGLNTKDESFVHFEAKPDDPKSLQSPTVWSIAEDASGILWLATWVSDEGDGGLVRFDPQTGKFATFRRTAEDANGPSTALYTVRRDVAAPNILWLGSAEGLTRFDTASREAQSWFYDPKDPSSLGEGGVLCIHQDEPGVLWLGTASGLNRFDVARQKTKRYGADSGVPTTEIYGVLPDKSGRLWLSTNNQGLLAFDKKTEKVALAFTAEDGLQDKEFAQGAALKGKNGELFFGGPHGFNVFVPDRLQIDQFAPPVVLTSFKLFNREVDLGKPIWTADQISLEHGDSVFSIEFAALSYTGRNRFAYRLEGLHDWIETTHPYVNFTNLDPGHYVFQLKAANRHGVWNQTPLAVTISVAPPLWRTWYAYVAYGLALVGLVLLVIRFQRRKLKVLRQENRLKSVERELELTSAVQTGFLPRNNHIDRGSFELFGFYRPADVCSGDWWWHEETAPGRHAILVGDVTGHGPGPAMVTAAAATAFRVHSGMSVEKRLHLMNDEVLLVGNSKYLMTMSALELDESTGEICLFSAGGQPAIVLRGGGRSRVISCRGTPLGTAQFSLGAIRERMQPGERILLLTDGMLEIEPRDGKKFGLRRFIRLAENTLGDRIAVGSQKMVAAFGDLLHDTPQADDWTLVTSEWRGPSAGSAFIASASGGRQVHHGGGRS
jgi:ligand-binding sensor domain-containing protein/serine phosphatase RsbU (regulator of sigma subunit)